MQNNIMKNIKIYYDLHKYERAMEYIDEGLSHEPNSGKLMHLRGECLLMLERYEEAFEATLEALEAGYCRESCLFQLALLYMNTNKRKDAEKCFKEVLSMSPNDQVTYAMYGQMLFFQGKQRRGLELVKKALTINPNDAAVLRIAFSCYLRLYKRSEQKKILEAYIEKSGDEVGKLIIAGEYELQRRRYKEAQDTFSQALSLDPTNKAVLSKLIDLKFSTKGFYFFNKIPVQVFPLVGFYVFIFGQFFTNARLFEMLLEHYPRHVNLLNSLYKYIGISIIAIAFAFIYMTIVGITCGILAKKEKKDNGINNIYI